MALTLTSVISIRRRLRSSWLWSTGLTVALVGVAAAVAVAGDHGGVPLVMALTVLAMLMFPYLSFATTSFARDIGWWMRRSPEALVQVFAFFVGGYVVYAVGTGSFAWLSLLKVAAFVGIPMALLYPVQKRTYVTWRDWAAVACIWLPFDTGLLTSIWTWPQGGAAYTLNTVMAINLAVILFVSWRGLWGVRFRFRMEAKDLLLVASALAGFLAIALPFGFATDFIRFNPQLDPLKMILKPIGIFFFIAVPEELLFRGLFQNFLQKQLGRPWLALAIAAVVFGATHLNNGPSPDPRYFFLATVAGGFYGFLYMRSKSLAVPALLHAAVDAIWVLFLHL